MGAGTWTGGFAVGRGGAGAWTGGFTVGRGAGLVGVGVGRLIVVLGGVGRLMVVLGGVGRLMVVFTGGGRLMVVGLGLGLGFGLGFGAELFSLRARMVESSASWSNECVLAERISGTRCRDHTHVRRFRVFHDRDRRGKGREGEHAENEAAEETHVERKSLKVEQKAKKRERKGAKVKVNGERQTPRALALYLRERLVPVVAMLWLCAQQDSHDLLFAAAQPRRTAFNIFAIYIVPAA